MIKCTSCGHENSNYSIYCQSCGALLSSLDAVPDAPSSAAQKPAEAPVKPATPETISVPAEPASVPAAPEVTPEEPPIPDKVDGFKYIPPEKDQKGSYTLDMSSPAAREKPEDPNDQFCLWGFILTAAAIFTLGYAAPLSLALCVVGIVRVNSSGKDGKTIAIIGAVISAALLAYRVLGFFIDLPL